MEQRLCPTGHTLATATPIEISAGSQTIVSGRLMQPQQVDVYAITLSQGQQIDIDVDAYHLPENQFASQVRIFDSTGLEVASSTNFPDPVIAFTAPRSQMYFVALSAQDNNNYDPNIENSGQGRYVGNYQTKIGSGRADLVGMLLSVRQEEHQFGWGDDILVYYAVQNIGNDDVGMFSFDLLLSNDSTISDDDYLLQQIEVPYGLKSNETYSFLQFVKLPGTIGLPPAPFTPTDEVFVGMRINSARSFGELNYSNNSNQGDGIDRVPISIHSPPDLLSRSLEVSPTTTTWGSNIQGNYTIENRGGERSGPFQVQLRISNNSSIDASDPVVFSSLEISGVDVGRSFIGTFSAALPGLPPVKFSELDEVFLGVVVDTDNTVNEFDEHNNSNLGISVDTSLLSVTGISVVQEQEPNETLDAAMPISPIGLVDGQLSTATDTDVFSIELTEAGRLTVNLFPDPNSPVDLVLELLGTDGQVLIESDRSTVTARGGSFAQHLSPGRYRLRVSGFGTSQAPGNYALRTEFQISSLPFDPFPVTGVPIHMIPADFNRDGIVDLAVLDGDYLDYGFETFIGLGDGTFERPIRYSTGVFPPSAMLSADFNQDGNTDLAVASYNKIQVYLGNGDGSFSDPESVDFDFISGATGLGALTSGDFNGDGLVDIAGPTQSQTNQQEMTVLIGRGDGTFNNKVNLERHAIYVQVASLDFNGDGIDELVAEYLDVRQVQILGDFQGDHFCEQTVLPFSFRPIGLAAGDFNGDGNNDLAITLDLSNTPDVPIPEGNLVLLLGDGHGQFQTHASNLFLNGRPLAADLNRDGFTDLLSDAGQIAYGDLSGAFSRRGQISITASNLVVADVDRDQMPDVITLQGRGLPDTTNLSVIRGLGHESFEAAERVFLGPASSISTVGDINNDGHLDFLAPSDNSPELVAVLGIGDGTFQQPIQTPTSAYPSQSLLGDFNRDGRLDFVTSAYDLDPFAPQFLVVQLGLGNGTFREARLPISLNSTSVDLATQAVDFNGDELLDVALFDYSDSAVIVLLGNGDGSFRESIRTPIADLTYPTLTDLNRDGLTDVVVSSYYSNSLEVLIADGNGSFSPQRIQLDRSPGFVVPGDFNGDGKIDIATSVGNDTVTIILWGNGEGGLIVDESGLSFQDYPVLSADLNGDRLDDLVTKVYDDNHVVFVSLQKNSGGFEAPRVIQSDGYLTPVFAADFNEDGRTDLLMTGGVPGAVLFAGIGDGTFVDSSKSASNRQRATPLLADVDRDGVQDAFVLDRNGEILFRRGLAEGLGVFAPPVIVNPGRPSRDVALLTAEGRFLIAAIDQQQNRLATFRFVGNAWEMDSELETGKLPVRIQAGDFDGDGHADLAVLDSGGAQIEIFAGNGSGQLVKTSSIPVGFGVSDFAIDDVDQSGTPDIIAANQVSGDVSVWRNTGNAESLFAGPQRYRAGTGVFSVDQDPTDQQLVRSRQRTSQVVVGMFNHDSWPDLVAINQGVHSVSLLEGIGFGRFDNPQATAVAPHPSVSAAGDFNGDGSLDLAILGEGSSEISILLGSPEGEFSVGLSVKAGNQPSGLTVTDVNDDGRSDLLVGNDYGDLLTLLGNGDGSFQPFTRANRNVPLAVTDLDGDGHADVVLADQSHDRVSVLTSGAGQTLVQDGSDGLLAPGAIKLTDLNNDGRADLIVANSGGNNVLVYRGLSGGAFGVAESFATGTAPAGITVSDLDHDGYLDLIIANQGSNDVSLLRGAADTSGDWITFTSDVRLRLNPSGDTPRNLGPVSTVVRDGSDGGPQGLLITNADSGTLSFLPASGGGLFDDRSPSSVSIGPTSNSGGVVNGNSYFAANPLTNSFTYIPDLNSFLTASNPSSLIRSFDTGGEGPSSLLPYDFNGDGHLDLLVANTEDGSVSLMLGDGEGFSLEQLLRDPSLAHPSALAFARVEDHLEIYVTDQGEEIATIIDLEIAMRTETTTAITVSRGLNGGLPGQPFGFALVLAILLPGAQPETLGSHDADWRADWLRLLNDLFDSTDADVRQQALQQVGEALWRLVSSPQQTTGELTETLAVSATRSLLTRFGVDVDAPEVSVQVQTLARLVVKSGMQQATWLRALEETANVLRTLLPNSPINPPSSALPQTTPAAPAKAMSSNEGVPSGRLSVVARSPGEQRDDVFSELFGRSSVDRVFNQIDEVSEVKPTLNRENETNSSRASEAWMLPLLAGMASVDSGRPVPRRFSKQHGRTGRNRRQGV